MTLIDALATGPIPQEWRARSVTIDGVNEITTGPIKQADSELKSHRDLLEQFGYNPDEYEIAGTINQWRKQQADGTWLASYFFKVQAIEQRLDLPALYAEAANLKPRVKHKKQTTGRVTIVALSDVQAGKTGSRGGTPELIERLETMRAKLTEHLKQRKPERTVLCEVGDLFEGFESGGNPMFTNDLSLAQQMDLASTEVLKFVKLMHKHGRVDIVAVPSNHTSWRSGPKNLGRPGDDLGLFVHKQVAKITNEVGMDAHWTIPGEYDESVLFDVNGTRIGVTHGNQFGPLKAKDWWAKQSHGGQPVGTADILLTGHYHSLVVMPTGRNPYTGKSKYWLQCPTTDNGSDWFRNTAGEDSDPGLLVFDIDENGFDLQSLVVL